MAAQPPAGGAPPPASTSASAPAVPANAGASTSAPTVTPAAGTSAPTPAAAATTQAAAATTQVPFRPLNVRDALSYLDRVKVTFLDQPEVYDMFLTIMKEFKSQGIDTPGVIDRVSSLFRGHPVLIQGFNTFLPPGYRIECVITQAAPGATGPQSEGVTTITVTTPTGKTVKTQVTGSVATAATSSLSAAPRRTSGSTTPVPPPSTSTAPAASSSTAPAAPSTQNATAATPSVPAPPPPTPADPAPSSSTPATAQPPAVEQKPLIHPVTAGIGGIANAGASSSNTLQLPPLPSQTLSAGSADQPLATPGAATVLSAGPNTAGVNAAAGAGAGGGEQRAPMEFNHAINYVNKIKNRFVRDPDTYKSFLEILQTYQKEGRAIQDVYAQVTTLFHSAPDLLDEFKQFLPDTSVPASSHPAPSQQPPLSHAQPSPYQQPSTSAIPPSSSAISSGQKRPAPKDPLPGRGGEGAPVKKMKGTKNKLEPRGGQAQQGQDLSKPSSSKRPSQQAGVASQQPLPAQQQQQLAQQPQQQQAYYPHPSQTYSYIPPSPPPAPLPLLPSKPQASTPDLAFFERVRSFIGDKDTWFEFLKVLNLWTQGVIGLEVCVGRVGWFLDAGQFAGSEKEKEKESEKEKEKEKAGVEEKEKEKEKSAEKEKDREKEKDVTVDKERLRIGSDLYKEFLTIIGWNEGLTLGSGDSSAPIEVEGGKRIVENVPRVSVEELKSKVRSGGSGVEEGENEGAKMCGPSYRKLPSAEISLNCSGRDALCWEVLNDEWVSQPSWTSDEGFVAHRKNPFEEALHRSEEERHEYDYHIEANLRTIALLEPIATRITIMDAEERSTFRLKPGLGNQSRSIYQRVIKKVYGREMGLEVIQALHENPCVAVPVVLARLKQKDEEWKRALREWNRVWREVDAKNFWKSLDHQAISLKAADKRLLTTKTLVTEIETIKREQRPRHPSPTSLSIAPTPRTQLEFIFNDASVLADAFKLVFSLLDRTGGISNSDKDRIDAFLRSFFPSVFALPIKEFGKDLDGAVVVPSGAGASGDDGDESVDGATSDAGGVSGADDFIETASNVGGSKRGGGGKKSGDLRKKALKNAVVGPSSRGAGRAARGASSPPPASLQTGSASNSRNASPALTEDGTPGLGVGDLEATPGVGDSASVAGDDEVVMSDVGEPGIASPSIGTNGGGESSNPGTPEPSAPAVVSGEKPAEGEGLGIGAVGMPELIVPVDERKKVIDVRRRWNLFANSNLYCIIRLFQVVYHRLTLLKSATHQLAVPPPSTGITPSNVPSLSLALTIGTTANTSDPATFYHQTLGLLEKLFDGEIDQAGFEDRVRGMYATMAYSVFTVDKLILSIVKLSQATLNDPNAQELLTLLLSDRSHPDRSTPQQQTWYRSQAESAIGADENLYRIEWIPKQRQLSIQLLGKDAVGDDVEEREKEWATYLEKYVLAERTPGLESLAIGKPFLERNIKLAAPTGTAEFPSSITVKSGLQCKICLRSYRLFFIPQTEDFVYRSSKGTGTGTKVEEVRKARFAKWLEARVNTPVAIEGEGVVGGGETKVDEARAPGEVPMAVD